LSYPIEILDCDTDRDGVIVPVAMFNRLKWMGDVPIKKHRLLEPEFVLSDNYAEVYFLNELVYRCKYIDGKYPNYKAVIPAKDQSQNVSAVDFKIHVFKKLTAALPDLDDEPLSFTFFGAKKGVLLESTEVKYGRPVRGVVMST
jgi:DNA polymerase III sliding clamp (beta) subunit (PCNA family)